MNRSFAAGCRCAGAAEWRSVCGIMFNPRLFTTHFCTQKRRDGDSDGCRGNRVRTDGAVSLNGGNLQQRSSQSHSWLLSSFLELLGCSSTSNSSFSSLVQFTRSVDRCKSCMWRHVDPFLADQSFRCFFLFMFLMIPSDSDLKWFSYVSDFTRNQ